MSRNTAFLVYALVTSSIVLLAQAPVDAASFEGLGFLPSADTSYAAAVSGDGLVIVGTSPNNAPDLGAFRWTAEGEMVDLGALPGANSSFADDVSGDGSVVVGGSGGQAFLWLLDGGMVSLGGLTLAGSGLCISADGSTVAGTARSGSGVEAFRWVAGGETVGLGGLPGGYDQSQTSDMSYDGTTIVGLAATDEQFQGSKSFLWTEAAGMVDWAEVDEGWGSVPQVVSADGSVVVGSYGGPGEGGVFRWTEPEGMTALGGLGFWSNTASAVSADGSVVVGSYKTGHPIYGDRHSFIWDSDKGIRDLQDVLIDDFQLGQELADWELRTATDISDDATVIVGHGYNPSGQKEAWRAMIPEPSSLVSLSSMVVVIPIAFVWRRGKRAR